MGGFSFYILGASSLGSVFRSTNESESIKVVHEALRSGINYIDVAPWYGHGKAETVLGKVIVPNFYHLGKVLLTLLTFSLQN